MKRFFLLLLMLYGMKISAQSEKAFFTALKTADVTTMETFLEDNIDFCLFEDQQIMSKKAAMTKLKNFLLNHKINNVEVMHKGTSKDKTSQYKVAKITTQKETFRVFVYSTGEINTSSVKEIRIDKF